MSKICTQLRVEQEEIRRKTFFSWHDNSISHFISPLMRKSWLNEDIELLCYSTWWQSFKFCLKKNLIWRLAMSARSRQRSIKCQQTVSWFVQEFRCSIMLQSSVLIEMSTKYQISWVRQSNFLWQSKFQLLTFDDGGTTRHFSIRQTNNRCHHKINFLKPWNNLIDQEMLIKIVNINIKISHHRKNEYSNL